MREWCGCGAAIRSWSYRRVLKWRTEHTCQSRPEPADRDSSVFTDHQVAFQNDKPRIGFTPTDPWEDHVHL